jgi:hypothetical protein
MLYSGAKCTMTPNNRLRRGCCRRTENLAWPRMISSVYRNGCDSTNFPNVEDDLAGSGRRDFAVKNSYALQGDAQVLLVSTDEAGLGFSDQ